MKTIKFFKAVGVLTILGLSTQMSAQKTTGDIGKVGTIIPGTSTTGAVKVIDNKGTIKYLQAQNGLTVLSNTTNNVTTTTWQLGGTLTDNTYIDATGAIFALDGIALATGAAATSSSTSSTHTNATPGVGWTLLVRDEATGATKKLLATDLIQSGQEVFTVPGPIVLTYTLTGLPALPSFSKVWVYRNGAKLLANVDYTIAGSIVTIVPKITPIPSGDDWTVYAGDVIEVQYIK
jgi:hypothetical protein